MIGKLERIQKSFNDQSGSKKVSLADLIVLGGNAAIEAAPRKAGLSVEVPFAPGRTDATAEMTDAPSFDVLEPRADGFRNYYGDGNLLRPEEALVDRANLLTLTAPEMTVLVGGLRALGANHGGSPHGVFTSRPARSATTSSSPARHGHGVEQVGDNAFQGRDRKTGELKWTATAVDLVFGSNSQLRALAEVYAADDAKQKFVDDFAAAWGKVMNLDRFDLDPAARSGS